jgi:hypothetical protein
MLNKFSASFDSSYIQLQTLVPSSLQTNMWFGASVAISGDGSILAIGASQYDRSIPVPPFSYPVNGAAYIFSKSGNAWTQKTLIAPILNAFARFGTDVALSDNGLTLAVGSPNFNRAFIYALDPASLQQTLQFDSLPAGIGGGASLGGSVALSSDGDIALLGAPTQSTSPYTTNGAAYVFTRSGSTWTEQAALFPSDIGDNKYFGAALDISSDGNTALIGSNVGLFASNDGAAYVFTKSGATWTEQAKLVSSDLAANDEFGVSVALSKDGNTAIVGARSADTSPYSNNGAAYVFTRSGSTWTEQAKLIANDPASNVRFGSSVAISQDGQNIFVGATKTGNGAVYFFTNINGVWTQYQKIQGNLFTPTTDDDFGNAVASSGNANLVVIGAFLEDPSSASDNGAAYLFTS